MNDHDYSKRYYSIMSRIQSIIKAMGIADEISINEDLLGRAIMDYFEDIDKLKMFEEIERTNTAKIYAYETYWLLRRKPIQYLGKTDKEEKWVYVNEIVCSMMLLAQMYREVGKSMGNDKDLWEFYDLLYYNLRFREYTQKSLELMISAFYLGNKI